MPFSAKSPCDPGSSKAVFLSFLPRALLKSARYQFVMVGIVDGAAENFRNVIITVSFRLFFIATYQGFFDFVESLQQAKIQDNMTYGLFLNINISPMPLISLHFPRAYLFLLLSDI